MGAEFYRVLISGLCDPPTAAYHLSWQQQRVETEVWVNQHSMHLGRVLADTSMVRFNLIATPRSY